MKITQLPIFRAWLQNAAKPGAGFGGRFMLWGMNKGHSPLYEFGLSFVALPRTGRILDVGCGGGELLRRMAARAPQATLAGIDFSPAAVQAARRRNRRAVAAGRMEIREGPVDALPWPGESFDLATACETVYFWPDPVKAFREIARVLKPGGAFAIVVETANPAEAEIWTSALPSMRVRTPGELSDLLVEAGFSPPAVHRRPGSLTTWACLVADKPLSP